MTTPKLSIIIDPITGKANHLWSWDITTSQKDMTTQSDKTWTEMTAREHVQTCLKAIYHNPNFEGDDYCANLHDKALGCEWESLPSLDLAFAVDLERNIERRDMIEPYIDHLICFVAPGWEIYDSAIESNSSRKLDGAMMLWAMARATAEQRAHAFALTMGLVRE